MAASLPELKLFELIDLVSNDAQLRHVSLCRRKGRRYLCRLIPLGGKPAMIMQNGGLMNSVNGLTSTALHFRSDAPSCLLCG